MLSSFSSSSPTPRSPAIAIVGMACQYADARSPQQLWENVLAQRQAFRRIPSERLALSDYFATERETPEAIYSSQAAVIEGYEFDRVGFRVAGKTYRSADLVHWLALDMAAQALTDAGFSEAQHLPLDTTGVLLGNTLTGEFSRANTLRLRWPYVRRVVKAQLIERGMSETERDEFLAALESRYKDPFPPIGDESLAGNLANTIAGRICNYFDFKGSGYTIDGACSSSLLAVTNACSALVVGDLDVALAGGVDLSIDPFELVGFAKVGALASDQMFVYDQRSAGFIPGEGCGMVVLMRYEDALAQQRRIYALIRGWGMSSDGNGGISRPEVEGQQLALQRAYRRAGFGIDTVGYFEGHGTGTPIGDATELQALNTSRLENAANTTLPQAALGSVKTNIGHTKAAAGVAGLIKATMALQTQILPPTTACDKPHEALATEKATLKVLAQGHIWPDSLPLRAGVSAMGFGGINSHVVLEGIAHQRRQVLSDSEVNLLSTAQDAELLLLAAPNIEQLQEKVQQLLTIAPQLSKAEMTNLAAELALGGWGVADENQIIRAAVVASTPNILTRHLETLNSWLSDSSVPDTQLRTTERQEVFLSINNQQPRIGFLFPGQASPVYLNGGAWERRFPQLKTLYQTTELLTGEDLKSTAIAQPAIVLASIAGLQILNQLGITAEVGIGHSLGELSALCWGNVFDPMELIHLAKRRGQVMAELGDPTGMMASLRTDEQGVRALLNGKVVTIAGLNSPQQTVISGEMSAVKAMLERANKQGIKGLPLPVSHAFHSPLVSAAAAPLAHYFAEIDFQPLTKTVISTVTGAALTNATDLRSHLITQITSPVRFIEAVTKAAKGLDLLIEVGPGKVLSGLARQFLDIPIIASETGGNSLKGLLRSVGAVFALGGVIDRHILFGRRFSRGFNLSWQPKFFTNPCELAPQHFVDRREESIKQQQTLPQSPSHHRPNSENGLAKVADLQEVSVENISALIRQRVAERAELPMEMVTGTNRLLSDLHLNSITVSQIVTEAGRILGLAPSSSPTDFADATVSEVAQALTELAQNQDGTAIQQEEEQLPVGVDTWIRTFTIEFREQPLAHSSKDRRHNDQLTTQAKKADCIWQTIAPTNSLVAASLASAFQHCSGEGVVIYLSSEFQDDHLDLLLEGTAAILTKLENTQLTHNPLHWVLVQHDKVGTAFARTLHLEMPQITTCVVNIPADCPEAIDWIVAEVEAASGYVEAHYDQTGQRRSPFLQLLSQPESVPAPPVSDQLQPNDVLLVTGGGKGIAAESALALAKGNGVRLALLGRSQAEDDTELSANLARMKATGVQVQYRAVDVTDAEALKLAVDQFEADLGQITAILHGAGVNHPKRINNLSKAEAKATIAPKIQGLHNLIAAINPNKLRYLITFGSIIARIGLPGEADYGLANEWLANEVERFQQDYPDCHCLNLEWSVWSGVGMGQRLGRVDALMHQGITPIPPDTGIALLHRLLHQSPDNPSVIIAGRFGEPSTLPIKKPPLPLLRFLERPRVYYPGIELIVEAEISSGTDPYLEDHIYEGDRIFPGVMGLEAMAQTVMALLGSTEPPNFEQVKFNRPIVVSDDGKLNIRIAALVEAPGRIKVVVRSQQTDYSLDHFQAIAITTKATLAAENYHPEQLLVEQPISLDLQRDLYGNLLFHQGRFQRLQHYCQLGAKQCLAAITESPALPWFSAFLPQSLVLGDPAARDTVIHALQACVPEANILPTGIEQLLIHQVETEGERFISAKERQHVGDTFIYDLNVIAADGTVLEQWIALELKVIKHRQTSESLAAPLLATVLERRLQETFPEVGLQLGIDQDRSMSRERRRVRLFQQLNHPNLAIQLSHRPDGKPELSNGQGISVSHCQDLTAMVMGMGTIACDLEAVSAKGIALWRDLLGVEKLALSEIVVHETGESLDIASTRVWCAYECLKKSGAAVDTPLLLEKSSAKQEVWFNAGKGAIVTFMLQVLTIEQPLIFAVLVNRLKVKKQTLEIEQIGKSLTYAFRNRH